jgi:peptide-methionine (S)-S-oxide reductase
MAEFLPDNRGKAGRIGRCLCTHRPLDSGFPRVTAGVNLRPNREDGKKGVEIMFRYVGLMVAVAMLVLPLASCGSETPERLHSSGVRNVDDAQEGVTAMEKATFAAGCFWGVEEAFRGIKGVVSTQVGYTGGDYENPTYRDVCSDKTGHAEAVEVTYDPSVVTYEELLEVFWKIHDPTTANRQGPDVGSQYRSVIFYHTPEQEAQALASKERLEKSGKYKRGIVTEIAPAATFYRAEEYHQRYFEKRGGGGCGLG